MLSAFRSRPASPRSGLPRPFPRAPRSPPTGPSARSGRAPPPCRSAPGARRAHRAVGVRRRAIRASDFLRAKKGPAHIPAKAPGNLATPQILPEHRASVNARCAGGELSGVRCEFVVSPSSSIISFMADLTGRTLGKYQLQERLGRGGMAEVYKAYQPGLDRFVAVKVLHPHLAEAADFLGRFRREAQAVARLRHPHIVQVYDFDVEGEQHYMVMEYVRGATLKARLDDLFVRGERMPVDEALGLFRALLDAVGYAHAQGMIHRDLKPANVMLEVQEEGRRVKEETPASTFHFPPSTLRPVLTDFGIAKILGGSTF